MNVAGWFKTYKQVIIAGVIVAVIILVYMNRSLIVSQFQKDE